MNKKILGRLPDYDQLVSEKLSNSLAHKIISYERQKKIIDQFMKAVDAESFFFIIDLIEQRLTNVTGIQKWLGYSDKDFTEEKLRLIAHPAHNFALFIQGSVVIEMGVAGRYKQAFMSELNYSIFLNLKHNEGHYVLAKRLACPFQYDSDGRLLEYFNFYTILDSYKDKPFILTGLNSRVFDSNGTTMPFQKEVLDLTKLYFAQKKFFSPNELEIIKSYAKDKSENVKGLSQKLKVEVATIETYHKRILVKCVDLFHYKFDTVKQASVFMREQCLV